VKINGYELELSRISNYLLYDLILKSDKFNELSLPDVPKFFIERQNRWVENPHDPNYTQALEIYEINKSKLIVDILLTTCVKVDTKQFDSKSVNRIKRLNLDEDLNLALLKYVVLKSQTNTNILIKKLLLTEALVYNYISLLTVTRNGIDILEHNLRNDTNVDIQISPITVGAFELVNPLHEYTSCVETGLNWNDWLNNKYELNVMAYTVAMYRLNKLIEIHTNDEISSKSRK
jgi:hypothetical protein